MSRSKMMLRKPKAAATEATVGIRDGIGKLFQPKAKPTAFATEEAPSLAVVEVTFTESDKRATFDPQKHETLLDVADEAGVFVPACCRSGVDGICEVPVLEGEVVYLQPPQVHAAEEKGCFLCIAVPKSPVKLGV